MAAVQCLRKLSVGPWLPGRVFVNPGDSVMCTHRCRQRLLPAPGWARRAGCWELPGRGASEPRGHACLPTWQPFFPCFGRGDRGSERPRCVPGVSPAVGGHCICAAAGPAPKAWPIPRALPQVRPLRSLPGRLRTAGQRRRPSASRFWPRGFPSSIGPGVGRACLPHLCNTGAGQRAVGTGVGAGPDLPRQVLPTSLPPRHFL